MSGRIAAIKFALGLTMATAGVAQPVSSYHRLVETPLVAMPEGDFDQLAADVPRNRLYVSAEDGAAIYVFDLKTGALLRSGGPVGSPHKIAVDQRGNRLFVADGADGSVKVLDADLNLIARIVVGAKPDTGVLDPDRRLFYVSSRSDANSIITAISLDTLKAVRTFLVPATTLKGLILDKKGDRLLVSMRDKSQIGVIHLGDGHLETWSPDGLHSNVPLALDRGADLLFAGSRNPGKLQILDARDGRLRATLPSTNMSDSMFFDADDGMLFVSGDDGMSSYHVAADGTVALISTDSELAGKTSLYVATLHRLYVMRPRKEGRVAALQVFGLPDRDRHPG